MKSDNKKLFLILFLAFVLRLISIDQSFWLDEATSGLTVRNLSFSQIIENFSPGDFHPPLYYLVLKVWSIFWGSSEIALRSLSVIFGVLSVYLTYLIAGAFGKKAGLLSATLLAVNGLHIYYSQEARMYSMSVFFVLFLIYLFMRTLSSKKLIYWFFFSFILCLNAFTDYLPNIILLVFWIYGIFKVRNKTWWKFFLLSHIPLLIMGIFWLPYFSRQMGLGLSVKSEGSLWWNVLGKTDLKNVLLIPVKFIFGRISFYNKTLYFALSFIILSTYSFIVYKGLNKKLLSNKFYFLVLLWFLVPLGLSAILGFKISVFSYFRLIFSLPALLMILAISALNLPVKLRKVTIAVFIFVSILSSVYYLVTPRFHREDWKGLTSYIERDSKDLNYGIIFASDGQREGFRYYSDSWDKIVSNDTIDLKKDKLWYIRYVQDVFDPEDLVRKRIEEVGFERTGIHDFNGIVVWEYENSN